MKIEESLNLVPDAVQLLTFSRHVSKSGPNAETKTCRDERTMIEMKGVFMRIVSALEGEIVSVTININY
jgi:hypothetical protein